MLQESIEVLIRRAPVFTAELRDFFRVCAIDGRDLDPGNCERRSSVCLRDIAATDEADVNSHVIQRIRFK